MADLCNTFNVQDHPTELSFGLSTPSTDCRFVITDITEDYNPPFSYGFFAETQSDPTEAFQYKRSWGRFFNVVYWNRYNKLTTACEAQRQTTAIVYEDGQEDLIQQTYNFNRDGYYTIYRLFVLNKSVLEQKKVLYSGQHVIVYNDIDEDPTYHLQHGVWDNQTTITYSDITEINDVVLQFENQTSNIKITGTQTKKDIVSICYFTKCYEGLNILITEQISNPCLNNSTSLTSNSGKSLFGYSSVNCQQIYNNPNMFKRDFLFMLITALRQLVDRCEYVHAEKLIEEIIGTSSNANCSQFTYLCGDTLTYTEISTGCGCR